MRRRNVTAVKDRTAITARWSAHDDNGDDLVYSLYLRGDGEHVWRLLKDNITDKAYSWDATHDSGRRLPVESGGVRFARAYAGRRAHGRKVSDRFEVDTTPPTSPTCMRRK